MYQPVACSLDGGEARRRWEEWRALRDRLVAEERSPSELKFTFRADDLTRVELGRLVDGEKICCGFVAWDLDDRGNELVLTVTGEPLGVAAISEGLRLHR